jgi:tetratricopeptide (TPR) repeat protein
LIGAVRIRDVDKANEQLKELKQIQLALVAAKKDYEANQTLIQIKSAEAWISLNNGNKTEAIQAMIAAAEMEDATEKHAVTPGEVAPARELLGDMYLLVGNFGKAMEAYEANLKKRPGRFNSIYGAAVAAKKSGNGTNAKNHFEKLLILAKPGNKARPEVKEAQDFLKGV